MERKRRGTGEKIILSGEAIKRPGDWPGFLANDEKKSQLVGMLLDVWSSDRMAAKLKDRNVILFVKELYTKCLHLMGSIQKEKSFRTPPRKKQI